MSMARFLMAVLTGATLCYWFFFLWFVSGMGGIHWDGNVNGHFLPLHLLSIYVPPVVAAGLSVLAFKGRKKA